MTVKKLRELLENFPEDYKVVDGELDWSWETATVVHERREVRLD